jgi:hypothetical protein
VEAVVFVKARLSALIIDGSAGGGSANSPRQGGGDNTTGGATGTGGHPAHTDATSSFADNAARQANPFSSTSNSYRTSNTRVTNTKVDGRKYSVTNNNFTGPIAVSAGDPATLAVKMAALAKAKKLRGSNAV